MPDDKWVSGIYDFLGRGYFRNGVTQLMKGIYHAYSYYMKEKVLIQKRSQKFLLEKSLRKKTLFIGIQVFFCFGKM